MARFLLATILVLNVVLCPLRCAGGLVPASDESPRLVSGCGCCQPMADPQSDPLPQDDQPASCPDCLCSGALLPKLAVEEHQLSPVEVTRDLPTGWFAASLMVPPQCPPLPKPPFFGGGSAIRISQQSLLL